MNTAVGGVGVALPTSPKRHWRRDLKSAFGTPALRPVYHLHGCLFTCWMLLLIVQPALVAVRRTDVYRKLGVVGGVLAGACTNGAGDGPVSRYAASQPGSRKAGRSRHKER